MILLAAGIAVFRIEVPSSQALTLVGSGLTGLGLGATVAPALFVAGFSLPAANLQRVFAIVELFRAVAAFMVAPIFVHFAATAGGNLDAGTASRCGSDSDSPSAARPSASPSTRSAAHAPDTRSRPLPGRHDAGVVLATAAGKGSLEPPDRPAARPPKAPTDMATSTECGSRRPSGPVLFAYDGSELAALAIEQAAEGSCTGRDALVLCVWQPADVGFVPINKRHFDADQATEVQQGGGGDRRARSIAGREGRVPGTEPGGRGRADLERDRRDRRGTPCEPDRARLPPPQRPRRASARQRRRCRGRARGSLRAGRARGILSSAVGFPPQTRKG